MECNRCGKCCFYFFNGKLKKCRYLIFITKNKSFCRIYPKGFGKEIDKGIFCNKDTVYNYVNCPFNSPEKPAFEESAFLREKNAFLK